MKFSTVGIVHNETQENIWPYAATLAILHAVTNAYVCYRLVRPTGTFIGCYYDPQVAASMPTYITRGF